MQCVSPIRTPIIAKRPNNYFVCLPARDNPESPTSEENLSDIERHRAYKLWEDYMASQPSRQDREPVVHQDYITRQRYSNALPPPPMPPKLLDIPMDALKLCTSPGFASNLARQEPLNIEADAFLGMPIDLVGMPGIFDGDESCKFQTYTS